MAGEPETGGMTTDPPQPATLPNAQALIDAPWAGAARLRARVVEVEGEPVRLQALVAQLAARVQALEARVAEAVAPTQGAFWMLLEVGQRSPTAKAAGLCASLLKLWPALWTFVMVPGVEPTNNATERAVRPAVLWRKGSFGSQSEAGALFVSRLLSLTTTCRQQARSLLDYLTAVCTAAQQGHPIPSLLPEPAAIQAA